MLPANGAQIRGLDHVTINDLGVPGIALMENAGKGATDLLATRLLANLHRPGHIAIFCGAGNNGGDGYVIARHLDGLGHHVHVFLLAPRDRVRGDADINLTVVERMALPITDLSAEHLDDDGFEEKLAFAAKHPYDVWVDALLGTGLSSELRGRYRRVIDVMNGVDASRFAVDIPSGVHADSGRPLGAAVNADLTATFGLAKTGLLVGRGRELAGEVHVIDIGIPRSVVDAAQIEGSALTAETMAHLCRRRPRNVHKGTYGHVFAVAGAPGKTGAAVLTGVGALRSGAGLVTVATHATTVPLIATVAWELMAADALPDQPTDVDAEHTLADVFRCATALAIGPGLGVSPRSRAVVEAALAHFDGPIVLDADALNVLADDLSPLTRSSAPIILTPHPGEMARLTGLPTAEILDDQVGCARDLAAQHGVTVVLKTATTVIAAPDGRFAVNTSGTPGMASAGMGDVLTGVVAGFLAQGLSPWDAARVSVFAHGWAGETAATLTGEHGLTARAVLDAIPSALRHLEETPAADASASGRARNA